MSHGPSLGLCANWGSPQVLPLSPSLPPSFHPFPFKAGLDHLLVSVPMGGWRGHLKQALRAEQCEDLGTQYSRATVNRFTIAYFWLALFSVLSLSALQGMPWHTQGNCQQRGLASTPTLVQGQRLSVCDGVPWRTESECAAVSNMARGPTTEQAQRIESQDDQLDLTCVYGLSWLENTLADSMREDIAILFFHVWMFTIAMLAILNESIPHLLTCLVGSLLGGGWVASRIICTRRMASLYRQSIVPGLCGGVDHLQTWWEIRLWHTVSVVVITGVVIVVLGFLSWKLLKASLQCSFFSSLGASSKVHGMYKLALTFSVGLQLTFFFSLASVCMWIEKINHQDTKLLSYRGELYLAAFIITLLGLQLVRKESKRLFAIFFVICLIMVIFSSLMFGSLMYRFIFTSWQLFATVTVTSFVLLVLTTGLGLLCRLNFGKGLSQYLTASEALEGMNFTPVYFPRRSDDCEKASISEKKEGSLDFNARPLYLSGRTLERNDVVRISIYSDKGCPPVYLSTSRPLSGLQVPAHQIRESDIGVSIGLPVKAFLARLDSAPTLARRSEAPSRGTTNNIPFPARALSTRSPKSRSATPSHVTSEPRPF
ncbi:hypothetical protein BKA70DRAFT_1265812 [Coprinopsis sp. MPI-PUGE-AT-0042]|nr:hypothetical protein BKA70DRAFT_1265812 [Coprinopsis sp. MPI-PUGE-AT-0042]